MSVGDLGHGDGALLWLSERCPARVTGKPDSDCSRHPLSTAAPLFENSRHFIVAHTHTCIVCASLHQVRMGNTGVVLQASSVFLPNTEHTTVVPGIEYKCGSSCLCSSVCPKF